MKILSYNVNGIRAALNKGFATWLKATQADVICLQETKALEEQVDTQFLSELGYHHYWFSAQKKGYSGVAIFTKHKPQHVAYGSGIDHMDYEGRILRVDFEAFSVMSLYLPSGTNPDRLSYKFKFMDEFREYVDQLKQEHPNIIICGDYNICHQAIDIHDPIRNKTVSGFLPEERAWLDQFLKSGFIDSFRHLNPEPHHYSWWSYRANARNNNKGWRIDYALVSEPLQSSIHKSYLLPQSKHSDHCPVGIELTLFG
ncbi:MAG: exodeoxyribonuclease III [Bacteroidetes bacterium]|nr:exodeoxyribonuclease III [Bacteroidota bacterium]MDA0922861.1 exodeoxyribonuclease III [Bacteroidota bacterium]MDA1289137.1 exodeoxyribonuclease III [Bacteroidota bacterium]